MCSVRTLHFEVQCSNNYSCNITDFMCLFQARFIFIKKEIFGITQVNHIKKIYSVTFKSENSTEQMNFFQKKYTDRQLIHLPDETKIGITVREPRPPATTVTLHPIPFETPLDEIANIVTKQQWGKLLRQRFGHYRDFPEFHNSYLHLLIENIKEENIPEEITINEKPVEIIIPRRERNKCNYCKTIRHTIQQYPKRNARPSQSTQMGPGNSYRNALLGKSSKKIKSTNPQDESTKLPHKNQITKEAVLKPSTTQQKPRKPAQKAMMWKQNSSQEGEQSDNVVNRNNNIMETDSETSTAEAGTLFEQILGA
ncbi:unnamed protein product [Clavelina lepadiformis]|uniref:Uncharacterized protein n=1 Tax=Clavelina lepadiformis TaxID=159417 RepID=A0ABP0FZU4_CLALP